MVEGLRLVSEAAEFAARCHSGQPRKGRGDEPYKHHLAEAANLLAAATGGKHANRGGDGAGGEVYERVGAGWLHDALCDTETTREEHLAAILLRVPVRVA